jgi:3-deoxy-D-manno-octulosonic-acid transferase
MLNGFQNVFAQSESDREQYLRLGAEPDRVRVAGNLKFDAAPEPLQPSEVAVLKASLHLNAERLVWIAGSTHEGEEQLLLGVHGDLRRQFPDLLLILAPRNPERASQIAALCSRLGFRVSLRSMGDSAAGNPVFILDTLGELGRFYAVADVAFVGGSWIPFGGHNPLEAAAQGKPACWGPHLFNFRELESALLDTEYFKQVSSEAELTGFVRGYLASPFRREETSRWTGRFLKNHRGAARRIARQLIPVPDEAGHQSK